jgi:S-DNA-T family DNA segregation ATPase FtsK/SpoIIIE
VTSLAAANPPSSLNFVLVDYKGKAAFRPFEPLPHVVGLVTDLDPHLTERALTSLKAELNHRKEVLDEAGVANAEAYWVMHDRGDARAVESLPRLVIIVDEFAKLATDLPEFITGLVEVATQGRSLGVHLVLATQRPGGVVSADIKANVNLRIALRTATEDESEAVIDAPDAGRIPTQGFGGRAYVRIGTSQPICFQTALATATAATAAAPTAAAWPWQSADLWPFVDAATRHERDTAELDSAVESLVAASALLSLPTPRAPWLPALAQEVHISEVEVPDHQLPLGVVDAPQMQRQHGLGLDIWHGQHMLVAGAPKSGRTTLLRTLVGGGMLARSPNDLQFYIADGGGSLAALERSPHVAAVVSPDEDDRLGRLMHLLAEEVARRGRLLAEAGFTTLAERDSGAETPSLPRLVLLIDRYDSFEPVLETQDGGRAAADLQRILRQGAPVGVSCVITGDRNVVTGRLGALIEERLVLAMANPNDYTLAGIPPRALPGVMLPGRGMVLPEILECQIATISRDSSGKAQVSSLADLTDRIDRVPVQGAIHVDRLPEHITVERASSSFAASPDILPVGVGGDSLHRVGFDLESDGPGFLILGPSRSGKSNALTIIASAAAAAGWPLVLLATRRPAAPLVDAVRALGGRVLALDESPAELDAALAVHAQPSLVLVDDADTLGDAPAVVRATHLFKDFRDTGHRIVVVANDDGMMPTRGLVGEVRRCRSGLLLSPRLQSAAVFDMRLPQSMFTARIPGRGLLIRRGVALPMQVPVISTAAQPEAAVPS